MNRRGFTLIEIMVSMILTAIVVSAVFSIALSTRRAGTKADRRQLATHAEKSVAAALRAFVTGDSTATVIQGPNAANSNRWSIDVPNVQQDYVSCSLDPTTGALTIGARQATAFALATGTHCLVCVAAAGADGGCFLPKELRVPPFNGYVSYTVSGAAATTGAPTVAISVQWREP
jgi:prepilin-type N-terminal cleavage/methylation domain-containing protein